MVRAKTEIASVEDKGGGWRQVVTPLTLEVEGSETRWFVGDFVIRHRVGPVATATRRTALRPPPQRPGEPAGGVPGGGGGPQLARPLPESATGGPPMAGVPSVTSASALTRERTSRTSLFSPCRP
jgi:hypothetical protein